MIKSIKSVKTITDNQTDKKESFLFMPNDYIRCNVTEKYGISKKFYVIYLMIDRYRSFHEGYSTIFPTDIINFYGYISKPSKTKCFKEIKGVLNHMIEENMIELVTDLSNTNYNSGIRVRINKDKFYSGGRLAKISIDQFDFISHADYPKEVLAFGEESINRETLLIIFLYVKSYIFERSKKMDEKEYPNYPEAFYCSLSKMETDLAMSRRTLERYFKFLTASYGDNKPLLIKRNLMPMSVNDHTIVALPTIYVLNNANSEQELMWATDKIYKRELDKRKQKFENEKKKDARKRARDEVKEYQDAFEDEEDDMTFIDDNEDDEFDVSLYGSEDGNKWEYDNDKMKDDIYKSLQSYDTLTLQNMANKTLGDHVTDSDLRTKFEARTERMRRNGEIDTAEYERLISLGRKPKLGSDTNNQKQKPAYNPSAPISREEQERRERELEQVIREDVRIRMNMSHSQQ